MKRLLKIASIVNLAIGLFATFSPLYSIFLLAIGLFLFTLSTQTESEIYYNKNALTWLAIILFPLNLISSILLLIVLDELHPYKINMNGINAPPKNMNTDVKRIDSLLKLGVGMISISGILFATTSWEFISDFWKVLFLIFIALLFLGLSLFSEKKLKIYKTTYIYWILSMSFFLLTIVATLYFGVFGSYIAYDGLGKTAAYAVTFFSLAGFSFATYLKFEKKYLVHLTYASITAAIFFLFLFIGLSGSFATLIISLITLLLNILKPKIESLQDYIHLLSYLLICLMLNFTSEKNELLILMTGIVNVVNLYCLVMVDSKEENNLFVLLLIYVVSLFTIYSCSYFGDWKSLIALAVISINPILTKFNLIKGTQKEKNNNYLLYSISTLIIFFSCPEDNIYYFSLSLIYLLVTFFCSKKILVKENIEFAQTLEPIAIFFMINSLMELIPIENLFNDFASLIISSLVFCLWHLYSKEDKTKKIYSVATIVSLILAISMNCSEKDAVIALLSLIPSIYLFYTTFKNEKENNAKFVGSYILILLSSYHLFVQVSILNLSIVIENIIYLAFLIMTIIFLKEESLKRTTYFAILVPLFALINADMVSFDYSIMATSTCLLYLTFLIIKFLCKEVNSKNVVACLGILISLSQALALSQMMLGVYVGIIGLLIIVIGYQVKEIKVLFPIGIIITILNIIYQLQELWEKIPFWLYLLFGGLAIIAFVTYKEIKNQNKN